MSVIPAVEWAQLLVLATLLWGTGAVQVAARSLNSVQRRVWASGGRDDETDETGGEVVEAAFLVLDLARQTLLILLTVRIVLSLNAIGWPPTAAAAVALGAFLAAGKLLPNWSVVALGSPRSLRIFHLLFAAERLIFALPAAYLQATARRARLRHREENGEPDRGDLGTFLDMAEEEGLVSESEEALLRGVADFEDSVVREVMTPRGDVVAINASAALSDLQALIAEHRFSRIPVTGDDLDDVVGIAHLKDLVAALGEGHGDEPLTPIIRPAHFVPETKRANELLSEFQGRREQLSIVVDEYGGTAGLITLEDVLEEIVGEIQDEDEDEETLIEVDDDGVTVSGKAELEDLAEVMGVTAGEGEIHTVGGLVFRELGRVPVAGEAFDHDGLSFEIVEADERRVHRVRVRPTGAIEEVE